ncbi:MAG: efflux RND transporter periplasmic adaptor subunit [Calditrichaeota bacterium]|nr:efflux RND transporter periplasmic adaptor subunit [Calditrichota bacterium]MCB9366947.1 efflux RND transporter periplasmic adaptor subunit [Calditrichota bacterium]
MSAEKKKRKILVPALIIVGGIVLMMGLIASRKKPVSNVPTFPGALVEVIAVAPETHRATVSGSGTVKAKQEISLAPQVGGKVDWVSEQCAAGGTFRKGDVLFRIEAVDYELAVEQARARVAQAEYQLAIEQAQADVAKKEWQRMEESKSGMSDTPASLVLREPQMKQAQSNLASAEAALEQAELALERTRVRAPFNGRVRRESVDVGQNVSPNAPVAVLYSTDIAEVEIGLPVEEQRWLDIPGSQATVSMKVEGNSYTWQGEVVRWVGALDSVGRLARVIVEVQNPYAEREDGAPVLAVGSFVSVEFVGKEMQNVVKLPRSAVHSNDEIWIAAADTTLEIRRTIPALKTRDDVYITSGLRSGERVILTSISGAANGMKLRIANGGANG